MSFVEQQETIVKWLQGIDNEVHYWQSRIVIVDDSHVGSLDDIVRRNATARNFTLQHLAPESPTIRVLDVGSGPISMVGNQSASQEVELHACDPLAPLYNMILDEAGVVPYVPTHFALGERLLDKYQANSFDLVHMRNALDHSFDPLLVVKNMLCLCKIGGTVYLAHHEDNAKSENYQDLHQWNIHCNSSGELVFWHENASINVNQTLAECAQISCARHAPVDGHTHDWITVCLTKTGDIEPVSDILNYYDEIIHKIMFYGILSTKTRARYENTRAYKDIAPVLYEKDPTAAQKVVREVKRLGRQLGGLGRKPAK